MAKTLFERLAASSRLPSPPGVVVRLLELTHRKDVSTKKIAETLALDPALSAKILRFVNSPLAGVANEVTSLQQAIAMMGVRGVTTMALSLAIVSSGGSRTCRGFDQVQFAAQSVGCGVAAKVLSELTRSGSAQETFLAGLLSQIGRSALASTLPREYAKILSAAQQIPRDLPELEQASLGTTFPVVGAWLLRRWRIPDSLCNAIETFRNLDQCTEAPALVRILHVGEIAAGLICPDTKGERPDPKVFIDAGKQYLALTPEQCRSALNEIASAIEATRRLLELPKGHMRSPEDIEAELHERLTELNMAMHLENQNMAVRQAELLRRATTDALTGIGNRAAFDARMSLELERSVRSGTPFALLMIDVDRFKSFNDTYGHQAGDRVLKSVAKVLDENVRKVDYVARYGGEEFAVIAPGATEEGVIGLAERLRRIIESMGVQWDRQRLSVTVSIGAAVFTAVTENNQVEMIIRAADAQLYEAKCAGRNRARVAVDGHCVTPVSTG